MTKLNSFPLGQSKLDQVSTNTMVFQDCETELSESVRNLGVFLDESLSMEMRVNQLCKILYFHLRKISKIRYVSFSKLTNPIEL